MLRFGDVRERRPALWMEFAKRILLLMVCRLRAEIFALVTVR